MCALHLSLCKYKVRGGTAGHDMTVTNNIASHSATSSAFCTFTHLTTNYLRCKFSTQLELLDSSLICLALLQSHPAYCTSPSPSSRQVQYRSISVSVKILTSWVSWVRCMGYNGSFQISTLRMLLNVTSFRSKVIPCQEASENLWTSSMNCFHQIDFLNRMRSIPSDYALNCHVMALTFPLFCLQIIG